MDRKLLTMAIAAVAGLLVVIAVLTAVVFRGADRTGQDAESVVYRQKSELLSCVPTDAVAVFIPSDLQAAAGLYTDRSALGWAPLASAAPEPFRKFMDSLSSLISSRQIQSLKSSRTVVSFHYTGELLPLLVIDDHKGRDSCSVDASAIMALADSLSLSSAWSSSRIFISPSDIVLQSGLRHQASDASVADADGFLQTLAYIDGDMLMLVCVENCGKIFSTIVSDSCLGYADFFKSLGSWAAFSIDENSASKLALSGTVNGSEGVHQFFKAFSSCKPAASHVAEVLPASCSWFFTMPTSDVQGYAKAYQSYADSRIGISKFLSKQKALADAKGVAPKTWIGSLGLTELAVARVDVKGTSEKFLLLHASAPDECFREGVNDFPYPGFAASVFGQMFSLEDESCCTASGDWLIIGSRNAIESYVRNFLSADRLSDAPALLAHSALPSEKNTVAYAWMRMSGNATMLRKLFQKNFEAGLEAASYGGEESFSLSITSSRSGTSLRSALVKGQQTVRKKTSGQTGPEIPAGPFKVRNTGTGKDNLLSCESGRLSLTEEGNELWAVPFDGSLCGRVGCVDFFNNGKLQFLFCSASSLHLYDRLGRPVEGFPLALGKEVALGPDVYDFSGSRKYNIMVLNSDNTVDMYNLKGEMPASWKGIAPQERITGLPEYIAGSRSLWVVHTEESTLVYPFYGGEPLARYDGNVTASQIDVSSLTK